MILESAPKAKPKTPPRVFELILPSEAVHIIPGKVLVDSGPSIAGWHMLEVFMRCPQLFCYRYILPRLLADSKAKVGSVGVAERQSAPLDRHTLERWIETEAVEDMVDHLPTGTQLSTPDPVGVFATGEGDASPAASEDIADLDLEADNESRALVLGILVHIGLAHHYCRTAILRQKAFTYGGAVYTNVQAFYTPLEAQVVYAMKHGGIAWSLLGEAQHIVSKYIQAFGQRDDFEVVAVEHPLALDIQNFLFTARVDLIVRMRDTGRVQAWDHKCLSNPKQGMHDYDMNGQIHGLQWHGRCHYGSRFDGVRLNILGNGRYVGQFWRAAPADTPAMVERFPQIVYDRWTQIQQLIKSGRDLFHWPVADTSTACRPYQKKCAGWNLCAFGPSAELRARTQKALAGVAS